MKFQELKQYFQNKYTMRVIAGILCVALAGGGIGLSQIQAGKVEAQVSAAQSAVKKDKGGKVEKAQGLKKENKKEEKEDISSKLLSVFQKDKEKTQSKDGKEETVYLITDANGNVTKTIVSGWLKNGSKSKEIQDVSDLNEIENVKGDETFTQDGKNITWQANGEDIYYQGTTDKETPITQSVTYYLDGKEISPQELAGKSGNVTIRFDYENHAKTTAKINGKKERIYVPFTVVSGLVFDDSFRNVTVNHGKVLSDGSKNVVVGIAMPGLKENLNTSDGKFDKDFEFPEYVEVNADVEDFSLEMTATVAMTGLLSDMDISGELDFSELDGTIDDLNEAMGQLKDGGSKLEDGTVTLHDSMGEFTDGTGTLRDSMGEFTNGAGTLKDGINAYTDGATQLADGIRTLSGESGTLESGVHTLNSSAKTIHDGVQKLDQALNAPMTDKEKAAAKQQVDATVDAQFQEGSDTYNMIYNAAVQNFNTTMTSDATVQSVQSGIQLGMQSKGLTSEGVVAALAEYYAANGFTDASGKSYSPEVCKSLVPGTETTYAAYFANALLNGGLSSALAGALTNGIASQGAPAVGASVTGACKAAAKQAGEAAAVQGAQSAKKQAAAAIEAKDAKSGYSLVSGTAALSAGAQQLADSMPALKSGIGKLQAGADELVSNNAALKDGVSKLGDGAEKIHDGVTKLDNGAAKISDGVTKLNDGAHELSDGLNEFDEKAISKLTDAYNGDVKALTERIQAIIRAGEDYGTFSGAKEGVKTTSKLIFRTDAVKPAEDAE